MSQVTISLRVDKTVHDQMKLHDELNWSAVVRKSIIENLEKLEHFDTERAKKSLHAADKIRTSGVFTHGKSSVEMIREWREKRK